jgi:multidrug efflux system outer membrane protein
VRSLEPAACSIFRRGGSATQRATGTDRRSRERVPRSRHQRTAACRRATDAHDTRNFHALTQKRYEFGAISALDVSQSRTQVEAARADVARFSGQAAQTANALQLLVGAPVGTDLLPQSFGESVTGLAPLPAGLPSEVLLRRPDVLAAEHRLRADNANIGAARAAFFPSIKLTGSVGSASDELSGLFDSGTVSVFAPR